VLQMGGANVGSLTGVSSCGEKKKENNFIEGGTGKGAQGGRDFPAGRSSIKFNKREIRPYETNKEKPDTVQKKAETNQEEKNIYFSVRVSRETEKDHNKNRREDHIAWLGKKIDPATELRKN